jgi:hypothetical protein
MLLACGPGTHQLHDVACKGLFHARRERSKSLGSVTKTRLAEAAAPAIANANYSTICFTQLHDCECHKGGVLHACAN